MQKEEILAKSREENKEKDLYEIDMQINAGHLSSLVAVMLGTIFFVTQSVTGGGFNFGVYAIVLALGAVRVIVKAVRMRRKRDIAIAVIYTAVTLALSVSHMAQLISAALQR